MKKRVLLFFFVAIFIVAMSFSDSITVTSPHSGDTWYKGHTYTITWTKSGNAGVNVKINVFRGSIAPANFIEQLTGPNNGSKSWTIPSSYTNGTYYIRIKGVDGSGNDVGVHGDSGAFTITDAPFAANITVTSPHSGDCWGKGKSHTITWTKSGNAGVNVKINIFRGSIAPANFIEQLTGPNDGSKIWTIPSSYTNGTYYIRIKGVDGSGNDIGVYGDSDSFTISLCMNEFVPQIEAVRDFEIKDVFYVYNRGGWIVARIKNYTNSYNGNLKFEVNFPDNPLPLGTTFDYTKSINMRAGEEKTIYLVPSSSMSIMGEVPFCGRRVRVTIDPDNTISETNERNNSMIKRFYVKTADLSVSAPRSELEIKKAYLKSSYKWRVKFKIHVKAMGSVYSSLSNVYVRWSIYHSEGGGELYSYTFAPLTLNLNEEKILRVDKKFGHPDKHRSIRPRLKEGNYRIVITVSNTDRLCERDRGNNRYQFTFRLH